MSGDANIPDYVSRIILSYAIGRQTKLKNIHHLCFFASDRDTADHMENAVIQKFVPELQSKLPSTLFQEYPSLTVIPMEKVHRFWMDHPKGNREIDQEIRIHFLQQWQKSGQTRTLLG